MTTEEVKDVVQTTSKEEPIDNEEPSQNEELEDKHDEDIEDEDDGPIYKNKLPNRVIVTANGIRGRPNRRAPRLQFYVDRARRILRSDKTVTVTGLGQAISMACTLVEVLKRQKIAEIESVKTSVDIEPQFVDRGRLTWGKPTPSIRFVLKRGEHALYVSDYHQRKVIEIFENRDPDKTGRLAKDKVRELNMGKHFWAGPERMEQAENFLKKCDGDSLNLPDFIRYASILIHPLLKDRRFKQQLVDKFGISEQDSPDGDNNDGGDIREDEHDDDN